MPLAFVPSEIFSTFSTHTPLDRHCEGEAEKRPHTNVISEI